MLKVKSESKHYAVIEFPRVDVKTPDDVLKLLEKINEDGYRPLHTLHGAYQNCMVCEKVSA